ncbi:MAG: tetratricopeptide repeat protein [Hyphomonas sp.]
MLRIILLTIVFGLSALSSTAYAETGAREQFDRGMALGKAGDVAAAFPHIKAAAEAGLAEAQFTLATMYTHGQGTAQSKATAREWYRRAAEQDHVEALYNLGLHYDQGMEMEPDLATALTYYDRASSLGHAEAAYNAGHILFMGDGVEEDMARGLTYFEAAAKRGLGNAYLAIGWAYEFGLGTEQNYGRAASNYGSAVRTGEPFGKLFRADLHIKMNEEALAHLEEGDYVEALRRFDEACLHMSGTGCYNAGVIRLEGLHGFAKDVPRALVQLRDACLYEHFHGCRGHAIAVLFLPGTPHKSDVEMAAEVIARECEEGDQSQCLNLAYLKYYSRFGMGDAEGALSILGTACYTHGYQPACKPHMDLYNDKIAQNPLPAAPRQRGAFENALHNGLDALAGGLKVWGEAAAAGSGTYTYGSYSPGSTTTYNQMSAYQARQDRQDFNNFINRLNAYGSGYAAGCRPGNPYC